MVDSSFAPFSLEGKTILVTGASSGIGQAIAIACSKMGARLYITARNVTKLQKTLSMLHGEGHEYILADLTNQNQMENLVSNLPLLDGVVQNAGIGSRVLCKSISSIDVEVVMDPNFKAPVLLQAALLTQKKIKKRAAVVFIASRAANAPSIGNAIYSASKAALIAYAKVLALELAPRLVRVNCVCPAMVWTDLILQDEVTKEDFEQAQLKYPLKRYGDPEDVANLCLYLLADSSSWMTGSCLDLTGGGEGTLTM